MKHFCNIISGKMAQLILVLFAGFFALAATAQISIRGNQPIL